MTERNAKIRPFVPVHAHLAAAGVRAPDRPALLAGGEVSYAALDHESRALASALRARGLERGDRVALWLNKSRAAVTSIYATLRAGAAYVPLDPLQPAARAAAILADSEPRVLVTEESHLSALASAGLPRSVAAIVLANGDCAAARRAVPAGVPVVPLEECVAGVGARDDVASGEDELAIILYTSGSTGTPKGVQIAHRNLDAFVGWAVGELELRAEDVLSNHAGLHFDLSTFDLFAAAAVGAAVWIVPEPEMRNPAALARGIERNGVTVWYSVPSILSLMLDARVLGPRAAAQLRYVLFAGEVFPIKHVRALQQALPTTALYNLYGPTETNVCTYHRVRREDLDRDSPLPIGTPVSGARAWIVPDSDDPSVGELMIEGRCVTTGYWRREADPSAGSHRRRVHATGDFVAREGELLAYRGRRDRMVKVSGFRVELGEIESVLLRHPGIAEAAVVAAADGAATRLAAFCAPASRGASLSTLEMKRHCGAFLPKYMIPHTLAWMPSLPKNANGKTDVIALSAIAREAARRPPHEKEPK